MRKKNDNNSDKLKKEKFIKYQQHFPAIIFAKKLEMETLAVLESYTKDYLFNYYDNYFNAVNNVLKAIEEQNDSISYAINLLLNNENVCELIGDARNKALKEIINALLGGNVNSKDFLNKAKRDFENASSRFIKVQNENLFVSEMCKDKMEFMNNTWEKLTQSEKTALSVYLETSTNFFDLYNEFKELIYTGDEAVLEKIKWKGNAEQFGYIFGELVQKGYIELPTVNTVGSFSKLAELCLRYISIKAQNGTKETTKENLARAINLNSNRLSLKGKAVFSVPKLDDLS